MSIEDQPQATSSAAARRRGRPRDVDAETAILRATIAVIADRGMRDASVDEIAARAHAGKDTIYRRWPHKADLFRAALGSLPVTDISVPDTGSVRDNLCGYLDGVARMLGETPVGGILLSGIRDAPGDTDLIDWAQNIWQRQNEVVGQILDRTGGVPDGDGRDLLPELLLAPVYARWILARQQAGEVFIDRLVGALMRMEGSPMSGR